MEGVAVADARGVIEFRAGNATPLPLPTSSRRERAGGILAGVAGVGVAGVRAGVALPPPARKRSLKVTVVGGLAALRNNELDAANGCDPCGGALGVFDADGVGGALSKKLGMCSTVVPEVVPCIGSILLPAIHATKNTSETGVQHDLKTLPPDF